MNFEKFQVVDNSFSRGGVAKTKGTGARRQEYSDFKYMKSLKKIKAQDAVGTEGAEGYKPAVVAAEVIQGRFYVANGRFEALGLANLGLRQFTAPDGETVLGVVSNEDASILKATKKGKGNKVKNFKSPKLEAALHAAGIIDKDAEVGVSQFITTTSVAKNATIKGVSCVDVLAISKGEATKPEVKAEAPVAKAVVAEAPAVEAAKPVEAAPVATPAPAAGGWE